MGEHKIRNIFVQGPIDPGFIATSIQKHSSQTAIGAHQIFLGQVRADLKRDNKVEAIEYTAYQEMALEKMHQIRQSIFEKHELTCLHVHHSLGRVGAGEISLFVFVSSPHRNAAFEACRELVERIKSELPVWGKEIFADKTHQWKENH